MAFKINYMTDNNSYLITSTFLEIERCLYFCKTLLTDEVLLRELKAQRATPGKTGIIIQLSFTARIPIF